MSSILREVVRVDATKVRTEAQQRTLALIRKHLGKAIAQQAVPRLFGPISAAEVDGILFTSQFDVDGYDEVRALYAHKGPVIRKISRPADLESFCL